MDVYGSTVLVGGPASGDDNNPHQVGFTLLSQSCFTKEQVEYISHSCRLVTRNKCRLYAHDLEIELYRGESFEGAFSIGANFTSELGGEAWIQLSAPDRPGWFALPGSEIAYNIWYNGDVPADLAVQDITFAVTVTGTPPPSYDAPEPVVFNITLKVR